MLNNKNIIFYLSAIMIIIVSDACYGIDSNKILVQVINRTYYSTTENSDKYGMYINRSHFGYKHYFDDSFNAVIILDAGRPTIFGNNKILDSLYNLENQHTNYKEGSYYTITLKFSYLEYIINKKLKLQLGGILQNHYITQEKFWGYRYISETFQDKYLSNPSGDLGIISYYKINDGFGLDFAVTNGEGFRFNQDNENNLKLATGIDFKFLNNFIARLYFDYFSAPGNKTQHLNSFFIGYKIEDEFRIGLELVNENNFRFIENTDINGISTFASLNLQKNLELFGRYDYVSTANYITNDNFQKINGNNLLFGLHFRPTNGVSFGISDEIWLDTEQKSRNKNILSFSFEYKTL